MTLTFKYKSIPRPNKTFAKTPSIPITLQGSGGKYDFIGLIDSGADMACIPKAVAELLGLDLNGKEETVNGVGGNPKAVQSRMQITISRHHETYSFEIPVKVILDNIDFPVLLGRAVLFDNFDILFSQVENKVQLKKVIKKK